MTAVDALGSYMYMYMCAATKLAGEDMGNRLFCLPVHACVCCTIME